MTLSPIQRKLERQPGGDRQMVDILGAILTDGLEAVEAACSEALSHNVHSAGVVLNILARHREPPPPLTITTPECASTTSGNVTDDVILQYLEIHSKRKPTGISR